MTINFEDFKKLDIRIGTIVEAQTMEGSNKLLKLVVDFGGEIGKRQILSGIAKFYTPEQLLGRQCPFIINLEPKVINEMESQGMILCADNGAPVLLHPDKEVLPGSVIH